MGHPSSPTRWVELLQNWAARAKALSRPRSISTISQRCVSPGAFSATAGPNFTTFCEAMMRRSNDFLRCSLALGIAFVAVGAAPQIKLVSNRETFDVLLERATRSIVAARGRTAIEFRVACDGYSTIQRSIADLVNAQGDITRTDFSTRYWEARDGRSMRFEIVSRQDGKITDSQKGVASLVSNGTGTVTLERKDRAFSLPTGTLFPTRETFEILNAAVGGEGSLSRTMFQGGGKGAVYISTATIGRSPTRPSAEDAKDSNGLL